MQRQLNLLTQISIGKTYKSIDPYGHQKSRINQHKSEVYLEHLESKRHETQMKQIVDLHRKYPEGLTDREVLELTGIPINIVSARRKDIDNDKLWFAGYRFIIAKNPNGKDKIRCKGKVRILIWTM